MKKWKTFARIFVMILLVTPLIASCTAWSENQFNNSLATETIIFAAESNITRYLEIPNTVGGLTQGLMNLTGYLNSTGYLEANVTGTWSGSGGTSANDGTGWKINATKTIIVYNFTKYDLSTADLAYILDSSKTIIANTTVTGNLFDFSSAPVTLTRGNIYYLVVNKTAAPVVHYYTNQTPIPFYGFTVLNGTNNGVPAGEVRSIWNLNGIGYSVSEFSSLKIGNNLTTYPIFSLGDILKTQSLTNLASIINSYLNSTYLVGSNYNIPFSFNSLTAGNLTYSNLSFSNIGFLENSQTFNTPVYEVSDEDYVLNLTFDSGEYTSSSANLVYNGTTYTGTEVSDGMYHVFSRTLSIGTITAEGNISFYWEILLTNSSGVNYFNSSWQNQTVKNANLSLCGLGGGDVTYLNFTFKDEGDDTFINASNDLSDFSYWLSGTSTKSYIFSNSSENPSYAFCFLPPEEDVIVDLTFKYSSAGYPIRTFQLDDLTLTNATTDQTLYLLASADGIYSTVQATEVTGTPISGASMTVERQFSGVWTIVGQGVSGSDGMVTFWVNPNFDHRITATKDGYVNAQVTIAPSQSLYTLVMSKTTGDATFSGSLEGMSWTTSPASGYLAPGVHYFTFNLTANLANLDGGYCKFELVNKSQDVLNTTTGGDATTCNLGISHNHIAGELLYGKLYVDTTDTTGYILIDSDQRWVDIEGTDVSTWKTMFSFFTELKDADEWGDGWARQEWNKTVAFFLFLMITLGVFSYFTQWDAQYPGAAVIIVWVFIFMASLSGWFVLGNANLIENDYGKIDKYVILLLTTAFSAAWYIGHLRRVT